MIKNKKYNCLKHKGTVNWKSILFSIGFFTILFFQIAFAGSPGEYAVIHKDPSVETSFKLNQMPSKYNYYYTGRSNLPYAVIGIDPKYTLISKYWYKIESKAQVVKKISHLMPTGAINVTYGRVLDSDGNQIGLWFSEYHNTIVRFGSGNELKVFSPYMPNDNV